MVELLKIISIIGPGFLISFTLFAVFYFNKIDEDEYDYDSMILINEGDTYNIYANKNIEQ